MDRDGWDRTVEALRGTASVAPVPGEGEDIQFFGIVSEQPPEAIFNNLGKAGLTGGDATRPNLVQRGESSSYYPFRNRPFLFHVTVEDIAHPNSARQSV